MPNKYTSRYLSAISRDENSIETISSQDPSWFKDFITNLEKQSVKSKRQDYALFDQINSAINTKSKYSSVEEAVEDMQKRTGLKAFLQSKAQLNPAPLQPQQKKEPELFQKVPALKTFIDNYIEARPGTSVAAVVHDLMKIKQFQANLPDRNDVPEDVKEYINDKIIERVKRTTNNQSDNQQLGKVDLTNDKNMIDDPLGGCMPARDGNQ